MECDDAVQVVNVKWIYVIAAEGWIVPAQSDQILRKTQMIHHRLVASRHQSRPPEKIRRIRIPTPLFVFEKLLSHEELRNSRCGKQQTEREAGSAARIPGAPIRRIRQERNSLVCADFDDVVIFDARNRLPPVGEALRIKIGGDAIEIDKRLLATGGRFNRAPDCAAQTIVLRDIKTSSATR